MSPLVHLFNLNTRSVQECCAFNQVDWSAYPGIRRMLRPGVHQVPGKPSWTVTECAGREEDSRWLGIVDLLDSPAYGIAIANSVRADEECYRSLHEWHQLYGDDPPGFCESGVDYLARPKRLKRPWCGAAHEEFRRLA